MRNRILFLFMTIISTTFSYGQQCAVSSGGEANGNGGVISYTIGQLACNVNSASTGFIEEGIQQPYEIYNITAIKSHLDDIKVEIYPNPTSKIISLEIGGIHQNLSYQLFNSSGTLLRIQKDLGSKTNIDLTNVGASIYFLKVIQKNKVVSSFKIIKN